MAYEIQDRPRHTPRVARKRQARMQGIVRTALAIAREEGFEALTLQRLADRLGATAAFLYRYFPSKDALIAELQRSVIAWLALATRERIAAARDSAVSRSASGSAVSEPEGQGALLSIVVTAFAFEHFARTAPVEFGLLTMDLSTPDFVLSETEAARVFESAWESLDDLAGHLARASESGQLAPGPAAERAVTLWASLQGVVQTRKLIRSAQDRIEPTLLVRSLVPTLLLGWGGDPAAVEAAVAQAIAGDLGSLTGSVDDLLREQAA